MKYPELSMHYLSMLCFVRASLKHEHTLSTKIIMDGGIARLRVYGTAIKDWTHVALQKASMMNCMSSVTGNKNLFECKQVLT